MVGTTSSHYKILNKLGEEGKVSPAESSVPMCLTFAD